MLNYRHLERKYYDAVEDCFRVPQRVNRLCGTKMVGTRWTQKHTNERKSFAKSKQNRL